MGKGDLTHRQWFDVDEKKMNCPICSSPMSKPVNALFALPSVASDCRPWSNGRSIRICSGCGVMKRVTNADFNPDVYKEYTSYPEPMGRTKKILDFVKDSMPEPKSVLDIGCGKGDGIAILQDWSPFAKVSGYEPTIHKQRPDGKFDFITLFHVFEHVEDLHEMLTYIKSSLTKNGHVLIQVPYAVMWPFDLVIADHEWHFNHKSLIELLDNNGLKACVIDGHGVNTLIPKELTVLASIGMRAYTDFTPIDYNNPIDWLLNFKSKLDSINESVAVYGTSVSAMWAGNILGDKVIMYLDDDNNRLGEFNGKPVVNPYLCAWPVVSPFPDWQLAEIKAKHPPLRFL